MNDLHCFYCGNPATKLCDGRTEMGSCDRPMCDGCVAHQSMFIACAVRGRDKRRRSHTDTIDYCRDCAAKRGINTSIEAAIAKAEKPAACPCCHSTDTYQWRVPGGGIQSRCQGCNLFLGFLEKPAATKSKTRGKKNA